MLRRVNHAIIPCKGPAHAYLIALCSSSFYTIEHAYSSNTVFPEFFDETVPPQDMSMLVGRGCEVEALRDESPIAKVKGLDGANGENGSRNHITIVLLERVLRRLGSCVITCGLLE